MNDASERFTAREIAACLYCKPQFVRKKLRKTPPDGQRLINGIQTAAWSFAILPSPIIERIAKNGRKLGYATPLEFLRNPPSTRTKPRSLAHASDAEIERAQKLQRVFASSFALHRGASISELARVCAPRYNEEFGRAVSDRYLRKLISQILDLDNGARNFDRLDIYLPGNAERKRVKPNPLSTSIEFGELDAQLSIFCDPAHVRSKDVQHCWRAVIEFFTKQVAAGAKEMPLKRRLYHYIVRSAPYLGKTIGAVQRNLQRKLRLAIGSGVESIKDGRAANGRKPLRPSDFDANNSLLVKHAVEYCEKRTRQAFRQLHLGNTHNGERFSQEYRNRFPLDVRTNKSAMPKCVDDVVRPQIETAWKYHLGGREVTKARPHGRRDWSGVFAGDYMVGDDETGNHYIHEFVEDGEYECDEGRFNFGRAQILTLYDELTTLPHSMVVRLAPQYSQWMIFTQLGRAMRDPRIGMPDRGLTLELGRYEARLVKEVVTWTDVYEVFGRQGIKLEIQRTHSPEAKSQAEGPIGRMQRLFAYGLGYVGRNERNVRYEQAQKFKTRLKRFGQPRKPAVHPAEGSMSLEQYEDELERVCERYANEPQNGFILRDSLGRGLSPVEGWNAFRRDTPQKVLPPELLFLLSTHSSIQTVTTDGVKVKSFEGFDNYYWDSEKLGALVDEKVQVRFNPELPGHVAVAHLASDPKGLRAFSVPFHTALPAKSASREQLAEHRASQNRFMRPGKTIYREFAFANNSTISKSTWGTPDLRAAGARHAQLEREHIELGERRDATRSQIRRLAKRQNLAIDPDKAKDPERVARHLQAADDLEARILEMERNGATQQETAP